MAVPGRKRLVPEEKIESCDSGAQVAADQQNHRGGGCEKAWGGAEEGADPGMMGGVAARRDAALQHSSMQAVKRGCTAGHLHFGHPQWSPPRCPPLPGPFSEHSVYTLALTAHHSEEGSLAPPPSPDWAAQPWPRVLLAKAGKVMVDSRRLACGPPDQSRSHSWCSKRKWGDAGSLPSEAEGKMRSPDQGSGEAGPGLLQAEGTRPKQKARLEARRAVFCPLSLKTSGSQT